MHKMRGESQERELGLQTGKIMIAFILAAGYGTRLQPLTGDKPKALVPFNGVPMLEGVIRNLARAGVDRIVVNVHHFADQVESFLNALEIPGLRIIVSDERRQLMDTGGALLMKRDILKQEPFFLVHNVDVLTNLEIPRLIEAHQRERSLVTMAVKKRPTSRSLLFDQTGYLCGWRHNKTGEVKRVRAARGKLDNFGNSCIQVISSEFFDFFPKTLPHSLTRMYLDIAAGQNIRAFVHNDDYWFDLGRYAHFIRAEKEIRSLSDKRSDGQIGLASQKN
jgi:NDP-sugar pyrophosphorylase family protein